MESLDFTSDVLTDERRFQTLNVLDDYNRQVRRCRSRLVQTLTRLIEQYGCPAQLRTDNRPQFMSAHLSEWSEEEGIILHWIQLDIPAQNAYIERFNGLSRRELLDAHLFRSWAYVRQLVED